MFWNKNRTQLKVWRVLPQREEQFFIQPSASYATTAQVWFTPEAVILDAVGVMTDLFWLWRLFKQAIPVFAFRVLAILALVFIAVGANQGPDVAVNAKNPETTPQIQTSMEIKTAVVATRVPTYIWPVHKRYISTYFSGFHRGIDLPNPYGTPVKPFTHGVVTFVGWDGGFGKSIIVQHPKGLSTRYAHLAEFNVSVGQEVDQGTILGTVGSTGFSTGTHLHFEVYKNGIAINPLSVLP